MKRIIKLENWTLVQAAEPGRPGQIQKNTIDKSFQKGEVYEIKGPAEVQEALILAGVISGSVLEDGDSRYCGWIQKRDWIYRCDFEAEETREATLVFEGIDTVGDIFLNGEWLGSCESAYLEYRFETEGKLRRHNQLDVYIHSPEKMLQIYRDEMPSKWKGEVEPQQMLHKGRDYGARFGFMPLGIYGDVALEYADTASITSLDYRMHWNVDCTQVRIAFCAQITPVKCSGMRPDLELRIQMREEGGRSWEKVVRVPDSGMAQEELVIENPRLWWPQNYGGQPLYQVKAGLWSQERLLDLKEEMTGLRKICLIGDMRFEVNGREIRLWGAGITPICGISHRYFEAYALNMLDKLEKCNMNAVRIWGPGKANPSAFYEELDRRGILAWQDFPTGTWQMPDDEKYQRLYRQEAKQMVERLKHHPCILLWCGGNEHIYMCELDGKKGRIGFEMIQEGFREICQRLDPDRHYHVSSPSEGKYANDPSYGDSHGSRAYCAYIPGEDYGTFFSEDIRVFPPQYKSAVRFMKEDIWEEGYVDMKPYGTEYAMPKGWEKHFSNNGHWKLGPIREFYDARTPQELIYKYAAAAAQDLYRIGANARTGNPEWAQMEKRSRTGHLFWKFNDTWPRYYCAFFDYYQECTLPYYTVKRVFAPLFLHFAVRDHLYLWGVNDTASDVKGEITVRVFHMLENRVNCEISFPAAYRSGEARALCLDELGPVNWNCVLWAEFRGDAGEYARAQAFVTQENMLAFPQAELTISWKDEMLEISADSFARCVELSGVSEDGDEFGWYFEDNYFDLLPYEKKRIRVESGHREGTIRAKAHYSDKISEIKMRIVQKEAEEA